MRLTDYPVCPPITPVIRPPPSYRTTHLTTFYRWTRSSIGRLCATTPHYRYQPLFHDLIPSPIHYTASASLRAIDGGRAATLRWVLPHHRTAPTVPAETYSCRVYPAWRGLALVCCCHTQATLQPLTPFCVVVASCAPPPTRPPPPPRPGLTPHYPTHTHLYTCVPHTHPHPAEPWLTLLPTDLPLVRRSQLDYGHLLDVLFGTDKFPTGGTTPSCSPPVRVHGRGGGVSVKKAGNEELTTAATGMKAWRAQWQLLTRSRMLNVRRSLIALPCIAPGALNIIATSKFIYPITTENARSS